MWKEFCSIPATVLPGAGNPQWRHATRGEEQGGSDRGGLNSWPYLGVRGSEVQDSPLSHTDCSGISDAL